MYILGNSPKPMTRNFRERVCVIVGNGPASGRVDKALSDTVVEKAT